MDAGEVRGWGGIGGDLKRGQRTLDYFWFYAGGRARVHAAIIFG